MKHWHRCRRWKRFKLDCPFSGLAVHTPDDDDDDEADESELEQVEPEAGALDAVGSGTGMPLAAEGLGSVIGISLVEAVIKERIIEAEVINAPETKTIVQDLVRVPRPAIDIPPEVRSGGGYVIPALPEEPPFIREPGAIPFAALIEAAIGQDPPWYEQLAESTVVPARAAAATGVKAISSVRRPDTELAELGVAKQGARFDEFGELGISTGILAQERAMSLAEEVVSSEVEGALATPLTGPQLQSLAARHNISTAGMSVPDTAESATAVRPFPKAGQGKTSQGQVLRFPNVVPRIMTNMRAAVFP